MSAPSEEAKGECASRTRARACEVLREAAERIERTLTGRGTKPIPPHELVSRAPEAAEIMRQLYPLGADAGAGFTCWDLIGVAFALEHDLYSADVMERLIRERT